MIVIENLHLKPSPELTNALKKLDQILAGQEELKNLMANLNEQVVELKTAFDEFGVAIDAEIVEINAKLTQLAAENPTLTEVINGIKAQTEKVHGIIVNEPAVPSVPA